MLSKSTVKKKTSSDRVITILIVIASAFLTSRSVIANQVECKQTVPLFYAGVKNQPLLCVKIKHSKGETLRGIRFTVNTLNGNNPITKLRLFSSGNTPYFSSNSSGKTKAGDLNIEPKINGKEITFVKDVQIQHETQYFWLVADISENPNEQTKLDALCSTVIIGKQKIKTIRNRSPKGSIRVFPFKHRVVAYYRADFLMKWVPNHLTTEHMEGLTDIILFQLGADNGGNLKGTTNKDLIASIAKLKKLRGDLPTKISIGLAHVKELKVITAHPDRRKKLATQLTRFIVRHKLDGVDLDWEYPDNHSEWVNFANFISELRDLLYPHGATVSAAYTPYYKMAIPEVFDQLDWSNTMSYDRPGEHSTMWHMTDDIDRCLKQGVPRQKLVIGLPFYSNEIRNSRNWGEQKGYSHIVDVTPNINAHTNHTTLPKSGQRHYFNGVEMIRKKVKEVKSRNLGGVMIWAYETDIPLSNQLSLTRAVTDVMSPQKR